MIITRFILETVTPLHCGGGDDPIFDQVVTRDAFGFWRIPGSSVAGILRSYLSQMAPEIENTLFGYASTSSKELNDHNQASVVWCMDAYQLDFDMQLAYKNQLEGKNVTPLGPFVRDHVNIDFKTSTATEGGKFDEEIIPPGTHFFLELRLDGYEREITPDERDAFLKMCGAIASGELTFGGKKVSGYGRFKCYAGVGKTAYACTEYNFKNAEELEAYLNIPEAPVMELAGGTKIELESMPPVYPKDGICFDLTLPLETDGPVMVGGTSMKKEDQDVDLVCLTTPCLDYEGSDRISSFYTLPGSSFRGILRHGVYKVAKTLKLDPQEQTDAIFGYISRNGTNAACGKIQVLDVYLRKAKSIRLQHVAIDRFTGGNLQSALFDEKPVFSKGQKIPLHLKAISLSPKEAKLLVHALLDLCSGLIQVGGGNTRGNGRVKLQGLAEGLEKALSGQDVSFTGTWNGRELTSSGLVDFLKELDKAEVN